jgi:hypothetical protein
MLIAPMVSTGHGAPSEIPDAAVLLEAARRLPRLGGTEVVEYRVVQHLDQVGERLKKLEIVTGNVTGESPGSETAAPHQQGSASGADASDEWAWVELNYRPHAYQACALTT